MRTLQYCFLMLACAQLALAGDSVATPEPGTAAMLALGVAGLGIAAWRRRKK